MRAFAAALAVVVSACGSSSAPSAAPPQQPAPEPGGASTTASPSPAPQPSPAPAPVPSAPGAPPTPAAPSPPPSPSPSTPGPTAHAPAIRWAVSAPGVFWVGMDDAGARWIATDGNHGLPPGAVGPRVLRLEKRDRAGALLWSGAWPYRGAYAFSAAVTPGGEPLFLASASCEAADPACGDSIDVGGATRRGGLLVRLDAAGAIRWTAPMSGTLVGADAAGACAVAYVRAPAGAASALSVAKLDASGRTVWTRAITSMSQFRLDRTGDVLAVGCYQGDRELLPGIACHGLTAARLGPDGSALWATPLDGYWPVIDTAADGTGYSVARQFTLAALSPDGVVRWTKAIGKDPQLGNQRGEALTIAAAATGAVAVAGFTYAPDPTAPTPAVILGFDAAGTATFVDEAPFPQPDAMVYGADGALLVALGAGAVDAPGGHVEGPMVVELTP